MTLTVGSLCSGFESTGLGLRLAGWGHRLAFVADNDSAAVKALAYHHPDVPNLGDITAVDWFAVERVALLHMGFPCTDVSAAGRRAGLGETRSGVWSYCRTAIGVLRPSLVLIENVRGLLSTPANRSTDGPDSDVESGPADLGNGTGRLVLRAAGAVLGDLAGLGYDAVWATVSAASVGAPHRRERVFILAWPADAESDTRRFLHRDGRPAAATVGGTDGLTLLPTPAAGNFNDGEDLEQWQARRAVAAERHGNNGFGTPLSIAVALLPTPTARDGDGRGEGSVDYWDRRRDDRGRANGLPLGAAVNLLPTPRATDGTKGGPNQAGSSGDLMLPSAVQPDRFGDYAPAITRWEQMVGRPAPDPTESGSKGQPRLSARFVEWMQGLPAGYVTDVPGVSRNDALRLLGNANPPQQYAAAIQQLAAMCAAVTRGVAA